MVELGEKQVTASAKVIIRVKIGWWLLGQNRRADAVKLCPGELHSQHLTHRRSPLLQALEAGRESACAS